MIPPILAQERGLRMIFAVHSYRFALAMVFAVLTQERSGRVISSIGADEMPLGVILSINAQK